MGLLAGASCCLLTACRAPKAGEKTRRLWTRCGVAAVLGWTGARARRNRAECVPLRFVALWNRAECAEERRGRCEIPPSARVWGRRRFGNPSGAQGGPSRRARGRALGAKPRRRPPRPRALGTIPRRPRRPSAHSSQFQSAQPPKPAHSAQFRSAPPHAAYHSLTQLRPQNARKANPRAPAATMA